MTHFVSIQPPRSSSWGVGLWRIKISRADYLETSCYGRYRSSGMATSVSQRKKNMAQTRKPWKQIWKERSMFPTLWDCCSYFFSLSPHTGSIGWNPSPRQIGTTTSARHLSSQKSHIFPAVMSVYLLMKIKSPKKGIAKSTKELKKKMCYAPYYFPIMGPTLEIRDMSATLPTMTPLVGQLPSSIESRGKTVFFLIPLKAFTSKCCSTH